MRNHYGMGHPIEKSVLLVTVTLLGGGCITSDPDGPVARVVPLHRGSQRSPPAEIHTYTTPVPTRATDTVPSMSRAIPQSWNGAPSPRAAAEWQILLDRQHFSPNTIDGLAGVRTRYALEAWQTAKGLPVTGQMDSATRESFDNPTNIFTAYTVTREDMDALGPVPHSWLERSQMDRLQFETVREAVAEKFHTSQRMMELLNPGVIWPNPTPGTVLTVPDIRGPPVRQATRLEIHMGAKVIHAYDRENNLIAVFPCSIARDRSKRPIGQTLFVKVAAKHPDYTFDPATYPEDPAAQAIGRRLRIPPGPNNPVGDAWIGLNLPGYGIHGTPVPEDIGKTESHGCFRLANWNATKLLQMVQVETPVEIKP